ncbi:hypothetical protein D917_01973 [Trichinella nativa]|uniref:Uncharacterized protein n=1 Tax=Trichinella nativa TaxID=6335 RepID=A0A1Y3EJE8_9BILA|nr:hypothetical protein D917_01973 [Trichinella nativa]
MFKKCHSRMARASRFLPAVPHCNVFCEKSARTQSNTQWENNYCVLELLVGKRSGQASASVFHYSSS